MSKDKISIQVVIVYHSTPVSVLKETISSLSKAVRNLNYHVELLIVDNGVHDAEIFSSLMAEPRYSFRTLSGHGNVGFGAGNNLAILGSKCDYVLILNPDVVMSPDSLKVGINKLESNCDIAMVLPAVYGIDNKRENLCRGYPTVRALWARMFRWPHFGRALELYELHSYDWSQSRDDFVVGSGCFMLCRGDSLRSIGGFDERFFLYFEDYDLTIRIRECGRCVYLPEMNIVHLGGGVAKKSWKHRWFFVRSALQFFNKHGWRW